MKIRAKVDGNEIEVSDEAAKVLIDAKIYDAVDTKGVPAKPKKAK